MHIEFVRRGGFAGISLTARVDSEKLAADEAKALEQKVNDASFFDLPEQIKPASPGADMFEYSVTISSPPRTHTVVVSETVVPEKMRPLLDHLTNLARTGKYR